MAKRIGILDIGVIACPTLTTLVHIGIGTLILSALHRYDVDSLGIAEVALQRTLNLKEIAAHQIRQMRVFHAPRQHVVTREGL